MYVVFFFFKQKTAYEMRISDWSSDVCSSDLFEKMPVSNQHVIMREVFKQGLTFKDGAFRTPSINPAFEHNLLILKEKGLLFLEQPGDVLDGLPSGTPEGTTTYEKR